MTEREYNIRRKSLDEWAKNQARQVHAGGISPQEWERRGEYYNEQIVRLNEEYSKSKEKEAEEYFGD